jgi:hypothetical protein
LLFVHRDRGDWASKGRLPSPRSNTAGKSAAAFDSMIIHGFGSTKKFLLQNFGDDGALTKDFRMQSVTEDVYMCR